MAKESTCPCRRHSLILIWKDPTCHETKPTRWYHNYGACDLEAQATAEKAPAIRRPVHAASVEQPPLPPQLRKARTPTDPAQPKISKPNQLKNATSLFLFKLGGLSHS